MALPLGVRRCPGVPTPVFLDFGEFSDQEAEEDVAAEEYAAPLPDPGLATLAAAISSKCALMLNE